MLATFKLEIVVLVSMRPEWLMPMNPRSYMAWQSLHMNSTLFMFFSSVSHLMLRRGLRWAISNNSVGKAFIHRLQWQLERYLFNNCFRRLALSGRFEENNRKKNMCNNYHLQIYSYIIFMYAFMKKRFRPCVLLSFNIL